MLTHRTAIPKGWLVTLGLSLITFLAGCGSTQIERSDPDAFAAKGYQTYQWNHAPIPKRPGDTSPLATIAPIFREETNAVLSKKGYREVKDGGDFVVSLQFKTSIEQGALPRSAPNNDPVPRAVINRTPDQASVDNAYAMAGPREMNNALLQFDDGKDGGLLWAAAMSRLVEDANQNTIDQSEVRRNARRALERAMAPLPEAP